ncbi:hypothetical protein [Pseudomonas viridiflava]|uniref:hypothetical protein n=1 Tax=Pseudomonas viridiflava TaxID=33069 RepID=UPI00177D7F0E|nr:hypothetical protein [Pseudomonas viridiflava]MBD8202128.1 hypothetical protein [Pseudomonas viridiflava]
MRHHLPANTFGPESGGSVRHFDSFQAMFQGAGLTVFELTSKAVARGVTQPEWDARLHA